MRWECYIEEYQGERGLCARLRDKRTNKKIMLQISSSKDKDHFLRFLSAAKNNHAIMPTVFERNGEDIVAVYGEKEKESKTAIYVDINKDNGGYLFE